jgi:phospholipid/cholesterol/gamma-HCH transport system ATP-binding protein
MVDGIDTVSCSERDLYTARKMFGVMFQDGALFGSLNLYDNIAFPLREHTKNSEGEIRRIVLEKMEMVGLAGDGHKFPGEISGGMRKRAGLARALVLDPQVILCDEPDSGLDPVRTAYLSQLLIDLNAEIDATILIVTHDIQIARTVPDNIGMLFRGDLVMFGPREVLLTSDNPVITQFVNGRKEGPIAMSEEKDEATLAQERATLGTSARELPELIPQLDPSPGMPRRQAVERRHARVMSMLHTLPPRAQQAILHTLGPQEQVAAAAGDPGELPGAEPTRPGRWRRLFDDPAGTAVQEQPADTAAEEDEPGGWPPHWPGGRR